jgi:hypothetical protein
MLLKFNATLGLLALFSSNLLFGSILNESQVVETSSISIKDLKIYHQNLWRNLSVFLEYEIEANENSLNKDSLKDHAIDFLKQYKNPTDFWEIINNQMVQSIVKDFSDIQTLKSTFLVKPDEKLILTRFSTVYYDKTKDNLVETFGFNKENFAICNETFKSLNLSISWEFKKMPSKDDYFDWRSVNNEIIAFFKENPLSFSKWEYLKPKLESRLLEKFTSIEKINVVVTLVN